MNILVFNGSPRMKGNTSKLSDEFSAIAIESGHTVYTLDNISPCVHCSTCHKGNPCPLKDSFSNLGIPIQSMDAIVIASPIHFFSLTPKALNFLTRLYPYQLNQTNFGLILVSGSDFDDSGVSLVINQFKAIDSYCGSLTVLPYHKVTYDKIWEVSDLDTEGLRKLLNRLESVEYRRDLY